MQIAEVSESPVYSCNQKQGKSIEKEVSFYTNSVIHFCYSKCVINHQLVLRKNKIPRLWSLMWRIWQNFSRDRKDWNYLSQEMKSRCNKWGVESYKIDMNLCCPTADAKERKKLHSENDNLLNSYLFTRRGELIFSLLPLNVQAFVSV